ncbi:hypothetical protein [Kitasatospora sp. NPDC057015]|uniref:hypothetical protein n=1 Tax=Kitasatospora sp. NPDC057015 TaxID=3346001 RepID=UPI0036378E8E
MANNETETAATAELSSGDKASQQTTPETVPAALAGAAEGTDGTEYAAPTAEQEAGLVGDLFGGEGVDETEAKPGDTTREPLGVIVSRP